MSSKGKRTKITPTDNVNIHKYKSDNTENAKFLNKVDLAKNLPAAMQNKKWIKEFSNLNSSAVATQTWKKYNAAHAKFLNFTQDTNTKYTWPLSNAVVNGFVTWCGTTQQLSHNTVKAYIFALSKIQKMKSFGPITFAKSLAENLNKGLRNLSTKKPQKFNTVSFNNLKLLKTKIFLTDHNDLNKICLWAVCSTAFFGSFRLGELLAKGKKSFDKNSDLTWKDIEKRHKHWNFNLKNPKVYNPKGEKVTLFPFELKKLCPITAMKNLKISQKKEGIWGVNLPVFRLFNGSNLTKNNLNKVLNTIFPNKKISCKSFRSAIPSILANFPNLMNDRHVMGWGRWKSSSFLRYQKFKIKQKKWVFKKMSNILTKS